MCRQPKTTCSLLAGEPGTWSRFELVPAPQGIQSAFTHLENAIRWAAEGDVEHAVISLREIDGDALREWYVEHAQVAGTRRLAILRSRSDVQPVENPDRPYPSVGMEHEILQRDGFRCRYCQRRVLGRTVLKAFHAVVGDDVFRMGTTNASTHGAALVFRAVADHVVPRTRGGKTDLANLVTACYPCNFGKAEYTLEQLQLDAPRPALVDSWDGLQSFLPALRARRLRV